MTLDPFLADRARTPKRAQADRNFIHTDENVAYLQTHLLGGASPMDLPEPEPLILLESDGVRLGLLQVLVGDPQVGKVGLKGIEVLASDGAVAVMWTLERVAGFWG